MENILINIGTETWKDVVGYEGLYQVSSLGRVKSLPRYVEFYREGKGPFFRPVKERILSLGNNGRYYTATLCRNDEMNQQYVHRLMCMAFLPNPKKKPQVNHINGDSWDNRIENLEWCTESENIQHSVRMGLQPFNPATGSRSGKAQKVLNTLTGEIFGCIIEAHKSFGKYTLGHFRDSLNGHKKNYTPFIHI